MPERTTRIELLRTSAAHRRRRGGRGPRDRGAARSRRLQAVGRPGRRDPELRAPARVRAGRAVRRRAAAQGPDAASCGEFAEIVGAHERAHIAFIRKALGDKARKPPKLDFGDDTATAESFTDVALKLEDLGVAAYNAQAPNLTKGALAAAARIVSVEARHAAWIRAIAGVTPAPDASEPPVSAEACRRRR